MTEPRHEEPEGLGPRTDPPHQASEGERGADARPEHQVRRATRGAAAPTKRGPGPVVLFLPILALLGFALWRQGGGAITPRLGDTAPPELVSGRAEVDGWQGSERIRPGLWLDARLVPLHADPARQGFDAAALASRFGLGAGEPWRLTLTARVVEGSEAASAAGKPQASEPLVDDLADVAIAGLVDLVGASRVAPSDPVATLFAAPSVGLAPGTSCDLFLWGERPSGDVVVRAAGDVALSLSPRRLSEPLTTASLARVDGGVR